MRCAARKTLISTALGCNLYRRRRLQSTDNSLSKRTPSSKNPKVGRIRPWKSQCISIPKRSTSHRVRNSVTSYVTCITKLWLQNRIQWKRMRNSNSMRNFPLMMQYSNWVKSSNALKRTTLYWDVTKDKIGLPTWSTLITRFIWSKGADDRSK